MRFCWSMSSDIGVFLWCVFMGFLRPSSVVQNKKKKHTRHFFSLVSEYVLTMAHAKDAICK